MPSRKWIYPVFGFLFCTTLVTLTVVHYVDKNIEQFWTLILATDGPPATKVLSAWTELSTEKPISYARLIQTLDLLDYRETSTELPAPSFYHVANQELTLTTRDFRYPDGLYPSRTLRLSFQEGKLSDIEDLQAQSPLQLWRLEPKVLAEWSLRKSGPQPKIRLPELPAYVPQAVVAMEDKRFYEHGAFDVMGLFRAVWINLKSARLKQGGSTISQQLARSIFLGVDRTLQRKLFEALLAIYLELRFSKEKLLEMYLNQVYWGQDGTRSLLGIESASRGYFAKSARDLTLGESAMLAGLLQSPNRYSPRANQTLALERRKKVLELMLAQSFITPDQFNRANAETLQLAPSSLSRNDAAYFLSSLQEELAERFQIQQLLTQGWSIFTTLDPLLQRLAVESVKTNSTAQASLVAIDPTSGAIRSWVGGTHFASSTYDRVRYMRRQPGSAFKPFVALAAFDTKQATPATLLEDKPLEVKTPMGLWKPKNYDKKFRGRVLLRDALVHSYNIPFVRLGMDIGPSIVAQYANNLGIHTVLNSVASLALGTSEVSILELTAAYGTLANGGIYHQPFNVLTILDSKGNSFWTYEPVTREVVVPSSAYLVTHILEDVLKVGTARASGSMGINFPAAGKTGTTENYQDAWFMGYTTNLSVGVWVGNDIPAPLSGAAASIALPIWASFMKKAVSIDPVDLFLKPSKLEWKQIDVETGRLAVSGCPHKREEVFLEGTAPKDCDQHEGGVAGFFERLKL